KGEAVIKADLQHVAVKALIKIEVITAASPTLGKTDPKSQPTNRRHQGHALPAAAKPHRDLVGAVLSAGIADPIGVRALAASPDVIGVETGGVRHSGNQHTVAINVDVVRGSSMPGEIHPLLPLHLVAARTERDLPRCRSRRRCWRCSGYRCRRRRSSRCRRRCRSYSRCGCRCRRCGWRGSRSSCRQPKRIDFVIGAEINPAARRDSCVPLTGASHYLICTATCIYDRASICVVTVQSLVTLHASDPDNRVVGPIGGCDPWGASTALTHTPRAHDARRVCSTNLISCNCVPVVVESNIRSLAGAVRD